MENEAIIGIDLAGKPENPTGLAVGENKKVKTNLIYTDEEILEGITRSKPAIIAVDAPFTLSKSGIFRKADREMIRRGYRVFPPSLRAIKKLTKQANSKKWIRNNRGAPYINT